MNRNKHVKWKQCRTHGNFRSHPPYKDILDKTDHHKRKPRGTCRTQWDFRAHNNAGSSIQHQHTEREFNRKRHSTRFNFKIHLPEEVQLKGMRACTPLGQKVFRRLGSRRPDLLSTSERSGGKNAKGSVRSPTTASLPIYPRTQTTNLKKHLGKPKQPQSHKRTPLPGESRSIPPILVALFCFLFFPLIFLSLDRSV